MILGIDLGTTHSAVGVVDNVLSDLDAYCQGRPLDDDITFLVLRVE